MGSGKNSHQMQFCVGIASFLSFASLACSVYLFSELSAVRNELDALRLMTSKTKSDSTITAKPNAGEEKANVFWKTEENDKRNEDIISEHGSRKKRQSSECGGTFYISRNSTQTYTFASPNYPNSYGNRLWCNWSFVLEFPKPEAYKGSHSLKDVGLRLSFINEMSIESHENCIYDHLNIYGGGKGGPLLAKLCGNRSAISDIEFDGPIVAEFKTDTSVTRTGFRAQVSVIRKGRTSGGDDVLWNSVLSLLQQAEGKDATYTSWGTSQCATGLPIYDGWAVGVDGGFSHRVDCFPFPSDLTFNSTSYPLTEMAAVNMARFDLKDVTTAFSTPVDGKAMRCAFCHALRSKAFTVYGWTSCNTDHGWDTAYSGVMINSYKEPFSTSSPVCVNKDPEVSDGRKMHTSEATVQLRCGQPFTYSMTGCIRRYSMKIFKQRFTNE
ncbi:uncharacterized protein [Watersipora subatra]|uniref:uncharacterized protein n=1 Tax=Watersipora subatra TaxID=2589382 RepID=UPI00355B04B1